MDEDEYEEDIFGLGVGVERIRLNLLGGTLSVIIFLCFLSLC